MLRLSVIAVLGFAACKSSAPPEPTMQQAPAAPTPTPPAPVAQEQAPPRAVEAPTPPPAAPAAPGARSRDLVVEPRFREPTSPDPRGGRFTLEQATAGLPPGRTIVSEIETTMGTFSCEMLPDRAPITVANFVGLARGLRDFWDPTDGRWVRRPYYDGTTFHRVIPEFMIQGGDVLRSGMGGPGYEFTDENVQGHNAGGLLCMANHGPNTNGGQFFITEVPKAHLDGSYSIFGRCTPTDLVSRIARVARDGQDMPDTAVVIQHVRVTRR